MAYSRFKRTCLFLNKHVYIEGREVLDKALAEGRGAILVTGHYGAVEFLPLSLALNGYTVTMICRFKTEKLKRSLEQRSIGVPVTLVDVDQSRGVMFEALKALKSNQIIITECDEFEEWRPSKSQRNRFLGLDVPSDRTLDLLQRRSKAPVVMGLVQRQAGGRYRLGLHSLNDTDCAQKKTSIAQNALSILERYILEAPHQWYQWKEAGYILGSDMVEETKPIRSTEKGRYIPFKDAPAHAY